MCKNDIVASLDLRGNDIRVEGAQAIGQMLKKNYALQSLCLEWNFLGMHNGVEALGEALAHNRSLTQLDLRNNKVGSDGASSLARGLAGNATLTSLDLRWNNIQAAGGQALADALAENTTLVELQLAGNKLPLSTSRSIDAALRRNKEGRAVPSKRIAVGAATAMASGVADEEKENESGRYVVKLQCNVVQL
jgi:Ran GTPase-activating protein (RanGAP) involved in mRNA processing and transport